MSLAALLHELHRREIAVATRPDGNILVRPWKAVPPDLRERLRLEKPTLLAYFHARELALQAEREGLDLVTVSAPDLFNDSVPTAAITPAASIIATCQRLKIALRLDPDGRLVMGRSDLCGKEPAIPPSLATAVEAHAGDIARLLQGETAITDDNDGSDF